MTIPIKLAIYFRAFLALIQMLYQRMRHSLGFDGRDHADINYFFVGSAQMIDQCRRLAKKKGLTAQFQIATTFSQRPASFEPNSCVVYDSEQYTFKQIIDDAARRANQHTSIGTYSCKTKTLITPMEIIR